MLTILTDGAAPGRTLHNGKEVQSRGSPAIAAVSEMEPLVANVALQLFAYHTANALGRFIDKARNIAKSVTVE